MILLLGREVVKISTILKRAKKVIETPERWTQNSFARDKNGEVVPPNSRRAKCFCPLGAVAKVCGIDPDDVDKFLESDNRSKYDDATIFLEGCIPYPERWHFVSWFNDALRRSHEQVMEFMDKAIKKAEAQEKVS